MTRREAGAGQPQDPSPKPLEARGEDSIDAEQLFRGRKEIVISHNGDRYVLRITRHGKLILNK